MCCLGDPIVDLAQSCLPFTPVPKHMRDKPGILAWLVTSTLNTSAVCLVVVCGVGVGGCACASQLYVCCVNTMSDK